MATVAQKTARPLPGTARGSAIEAGRVLGYSAAMRLWLYWEDPPGKDMPAYIALSRAAILYQCRDLDITIVTPQNLRDFLPDLHPNIERITLKGGDGTPALAIKTGFIRTLLLRRYGGLYIDIDSLPFRSLGFVFEEIRRHGFVAVRRTSARGRHISIGFLGARPDSPVVNAYAEALERTLSQRHEYEWGEIGAYLLTPVVDRHLADCLIYPEELVHPVVAEKQYLFMAKDLEPSDIGTPETFIAMLFHRPFTGPSKAVPKYDLPAAPEGWLGGWSMEDLYRGDILLSKLFRKALPEPEFNACWREYQRAARA